MINETAKEFTQNMGIENIDLSKGTEQYKMAMGGQIYYAFEAKIERKEK